MISSDRTVEIAVTALGYKKVVLVVLTVTAGSSFQSSFDLSTTRHKREQKSGFSQMLSEETFQSQCAILHKSVSLFGKSMHTFSLNNSKTKKNTPTRMYHSTDTVDPPDDMPESLLLKTP